MDTNSIFVPNNHYTAGRDGFTIKYVIIHAIQGKPGQTAYEIAKRFQIEANFPEIPHYVIDRMGYVVQCISEDDRAPANSLVDDGAEQWFKQNAFDQSIAVTFVKLSPQNLDEINPHQRVSFLSLLRRIIQRNPAIRWAKANENGGVIGHFAMAPITKFSCPGLINWEGLWVALRDMSAPPPGNCWPV